MPSLAGEYQTHLVSHAELEIGAQNSNEGQNCHARQVLADAVPHTL